MTGVSGTGREGPAGRAATTPGRAVGAGEGSTSVARPFEYAVLRVVPRVDRGEFVNGAVLLYCQGASFLGARVRPDLACVRALWPDADVSAIAQSLAGLAAVADGRAESGEVGQADPGRRFRWLTAPRSAVIQPGPVHTGVTTDPREELERLAVRMLG